MYFIFLTVSLFYGILQLFNNRICSYLNKKIIINLLLLIIFILFTFNRFNEDYKAYIDIFENEHNVEIGYIALIKVIKCFGGTHQILIFIVGLGLIFGILRNVKKITYSIWILFFYFIDTFVYDINQLRNLICYILILIGLNYLVKNRNRKYLILNTIAIFFHRIGLIYYLFFFMNLFKLKNYKKLIKIGFFLGYLIIPIFMITMLKLFPEKATVYFKAKIRLGNMMYYILILIDLFLLKYLKLFDPETKEEEVYLKFILFPIIFLPYSALSIELITRIYRNTLLVKWLYILKNIEFQGMEKKIITLLFLFIGAVFPTIVLIYKEYDFWERLVNSLAYIGWF